MKKHVFKSHYLFIILLFYSTLTWAQNPPEKFGKISEDDFKYEICPIDSNAHAFYIFDYGESYFRYADTNLRSDDPSGSRKGFQLYFNRHFRMQIVDNQAFSWADIEIPLYRDESEEKIVKLNAVTYNLVDGKVEKTKLSNSDILIEETSKNWIQQKFAMPNVREGSIIEVEYIIQSEYFFNLRSWYFQYTIPVLKSEYHVSIPEYYFFNHTQKGYFPIKFEEEQRFKELKITYRDVEGGYSQNNSKYTSNYRYSENVSHFTAENVPAFETEEFLRTYQNYVGKLEFEINYTKFPNAGVKSYTTSWDEINSDLLKNQYFGDQIDQKFHDKDVVEKLVNLKLDQLALLDTAYEFIKSELSWDGNNSKYIESNLSRAYKDGGGNSADVNLNLLILLRHLGFAAHPVILSTQSNGIIHPAHPSISRFNYVICMVKVGDAVYLLDATDPHAQINLLPVRCLNDKGMIVHESGPQWIDLMDYKKFSFVESYEIKVSRDLGLSGMNQMKLADYAAYQYARNIKKYSNLEEYKEHIETENDGYSVHEIKVEEPDKSNSSLRLSIDFSQENYLEQAGEITLFKPAFQPFIDENPFKLEKREYPVEFNYPYSVRQIYNIEVPEGMVISELPSSLNLRSPDGVLSYTFNINQVDNKIVLMINLFIKKSIFLPQDYEGLKNFYQTIVDKQNELVVLKSKT